MPAHRDPDGVWRELDPQAQNFMADCHGAYQVVDAARTGERRARMSKFLLRKATTWQQVLRCTAGWVM